MSFLALPLAGILGLGGPELLIILVIMLLLFGGSKLPSLARGLGQSIKEFKNAAKDDPAPAPAQKTETKTDATPGKN